MIVGRGRERSVFLFIVMFVWLLFFCTRSNQSFDHIGEFFQRPHVRQCEDSLLNHDELILVLSWKATTALHICDMIGLYPLQFRGLGILHYTGQY